MPRLSFSVERERARELQSGKENSDLICFVTDSQECVNVSSVVECGCCCRRADGMYAQRWLGVQEGARAQRASQGAVTRIFCAFGIFKYTQPLLHRCCTRNASGPQQLGNVTRWHALLAHCLILEDTCISCTTIPATMCMHRSN